MQIYTYVLKNGAKKTNQHEKVKNNRNFTENIKKHKTIQHVAINKKSVYGIKNLKLKI